MSAFLARRALQSLVVLAVMSFVIYALIGLMPGDPVDMMAAGNPGITPAVMAQLRALYGIDQPIWMRYGHWLLAALHGDLGYSRLHGLPVLRVLGPALLQTCKLMLSSFALAVVVAFTLGTLAAIRAGGLVDALVSVFALAGVSVPVFWLALILILLFAVTLHWLPASGISGVGAGGLFDQMRHLVLPVATLGLATAGEFTRYVRASMIEVLRMEFVRTARAKGAKEPRVLLVHAIRNAMIPVVTVLALSFGGLFSGALITETMFGQPGMGKLIVDAVMGNDYNLALTGLLFATGVTLLANLVADLAYVWLDPRIVLQ
jgi:peptide/nickel transport system permease protein